jgi:putative membrane protein
MTYSSFKFSNLSYFLIALFLCYHTIGGHFTFELVPFDWGNNLLLKLGLGFILFQPRDRQKHQPKNALSGQNYYALQAK